MDLLGCEWDTAQWLIFSNNGEPLIYYSHLTSIAIFAGLFIVTFLKLRPWPKHTFRLMALSYVVWLSCDLVLWANEQVGHVMFFWTIINLVEPLIFIFSFAFFYQFAEGKMVPPQGRWIIFALLIPTLVMAPLGLSTVGFDYTTCDRNVIEGIAAYYNYFLEALFLCLIIFKTIQLSFSSSYNRNRGKLISMASGTSLLLFSFLLANFLGTFTGDYVTSQYGHIAVPVFAAFLAYITIKYESFEPRILLIDILVGGLSIVLLSLFFVRDAEYQIYANVIAFTLMIPLGYSLIRGIRKEVFSRRRIERLAEDLEKANERLKELDRAKSEFLSIASHQLRTPLASIRGYISLLTEGDYGQLPENMREPMEHVQESARLMNTSIEDYLNVSRIEQGRMKYEMQDLDLVDLTKRTVEELRGDAKRKGLTLESDIKLPTALMRGDLGKLKQLISNLIDNSIKYTQKGSVTVTLSEGANNTVRVTISDTGVGIPKEEIGGLFEKFKRASGAGKVNTTGTGLGLYVAKSIVEAHKGKIWIESEGSGKGSRFIFEVPRK
jgi:signal transduction histidine kinase